MYRKLLFSVFLMLPVFLFAQGKLKISGTIYDAKSKEALPFANVYIQSTLNGAVADEHGKFVLYPAQLPANLIFSFIGYERKNISISANNASIEVYLNPLVQQIEEVVVTAKKKPRSISDAQDMYISDYEFFDGNLLLLGYKNKNLFGPQILLMDKYGTTMASREIQTGNKLFKDPFNNIHLLTKDSSFQVHYNKKSLYLLYPSDKQEFIDLFPSYLKVHKNRAIMRQYAYEDQALLYFTYNPIDSSITKLYFSAKPELLRIHDNLSDKIRINKKGDTYSKYNVFDHDERFIKMAFYAPIFCPLEIINDTLTFFDFTNSFIHYVDINGYLCDLPTQIDFHFKAGWTKKLFFDKAQNQLYTEYKISNVSYIYRINRHTGELSEDYTKIPKLQNISKINIYDGFVYFLYEEKNYPFYSRLYKMALR